MKTIMFYAIEKDNSVVAYRWLNIEDQFGLKVVDLIKSNVTKIVMDHPGNIEIWMIDNNNELKDLWRAATGNRDKRWMEAKYVFKDYLERYGLRIY